MEWIASFLLVFLVISTLVQLVWAYSLAVIAQKDGQSDLMQVLAWIPILQMAPMIVAGGGSVIGFVVGVIGLMVGAVALGIATAVLGGTVGGAIAGLALVLAVLLCLVYFGRLFWATAVSRNLAGWVGLLLFVPLVNLFVYPFIAFHDGWAVPNKVGIVLGLVLTIGSSAPSFKSVQMLNQEGGLPPELVALLSGDSALQDLMELQATNASLKASAPDPARMNVEGIEVDQTASIRALYSMQGRFENLEQLAASPDIDQPQRQQRALELLRSLDAELKAHRHVLDAETYQKLATSLVQTEGRIYQGSAAHGRSPGGLTRAHGPGDRSGVLDAPGPAAIHSDLDRSPAPIRPFPVQAADGCPVGTQLQSRTEKQGEEEWCQQHEALGGLRHGWYAQYLPSGQPESMGEYSNGLRVGVWTRFYPDGGIRAQAQFKGGLQDGWLLSFDESGKRTKAIRFREGVAVP